MYIICFENHHRQHLQIYWNSSNIRFHSTEFLTVYLGDLIDFLCPYYEDEYLTFDIEYNTLYLVNENDYFHCNTTNYIPLIKCDKPFDTQQLIYTLSISKYLPYPNLPEFDDGQFYYFISTSSGQLDEIDQRSDGLCRTKNMKLIVSVQKYYQHHYEQQQKSPKSILAKRTNLTFIDPNKRSFSTSSWSSITSRNIYFTLMLLLFCLLTKSKT